MFLLRVLGKVLPKTCWESMIIDSFRHRSFTNVLLDKVFGKPSLLNRFYFILFIANCDDLLLRREMFCLSLFRWYYLINRLKDDIFFISRLRFCIPGKAFSKIFHFNLSLRNRIIVVSCRLFSRQNFRSYCWRERSSLWNTVFDQIFWFIFLRNLIFSRFCNFWPFE